MFTPIFCLSKTCILLKVRVTKLNPPNVEQTIDDETGWRMVVPTTLKCFLCGGQVIYKNKDTTRSSSIINTISIINFASDEWATRNNAIFKSSPNFHFQDLSLPGFTTIWLTSTAWCSRWTLSWPLVGLYLCICICIWLCICCEELHFGRS